MRSVAGHMPRAKYSLWLNCNPTENVPIITPPLAELMSDTEKIGERANVLPDHPPPQKQKTDGRFVRSTGPVHGKYGLFPHTCQEERCKEVGNRP